MPADLIIKDAKPPRYSVIPWGTGAVGAEMVTTIIDHRPDLEIVGARVYSDGKDGADIGTLVGRNPIGVTATTDIRAASTRAGPAMELVGPPTWRDAHRDRNALHRRWGVPEALAQTRARLDVDH